MKEFKFSANLKKIVKLLIQIVIGISLAILITQFIAQPMFVTGPSMEPTVYNGAFGFGNRIYSAEDIKRFDIVVVETPTGKNIIKRVIGLPGDEVVYMDNKLYINGVQTQDVVNAKTDNLVVKVPEGEYFCLGDNRPNSSDSRYYGTFAYNKIVSKDVYILIPFKWKLK